MNWNYVRYCTVDRNSVGHSLERIETVQPTQYSRQELSPTQNSGHELYRLIGIYWTGIVNINCVAMLYSGQELRRLLSTVDKNCRLC